MSGSRDDDGEAAGGLGRRGRRHPDGIGVPDGEAGGVPDGDAGGVPDGDANGVQGATAGPAGFDFCATTSSSTLGAFDAPIR